MIYIVISIVVFGYILNQLYKRIGKLEKLVGTQSDNGEDNRFSWSFNVNVEWSVVTNPIFGKISGIKSPGEGKVASSWTDKEQRLWQKNWKEQISTKTHFTLTYLSKEDAFVSKYPDGNPHFVFSGGSEQDIFRETIAEKKDGDSIDYFGSDSLTICARDRFIELENKTRIRVLTIYLEERSNSKENYKILCDFPFTNPNLVEENKLFGFEVDHSNGDVYKDENKPFGPMPGWSRGPDFTTWKKNGVEIFHAHHPG